MGNVKKKRIIVILSAIAVFVASITGIIYFTTNSGKRDEVKASTYTEIGGDFSSNYISSFELLDNTKSASLANLVTGANLYSDLEITDTFQSIPARYVGAEYILTENSLFRNDTNIFTINVDTDCTIMVMFRASDGLPTWIDENGFTYSNQVVITARGITYKVFEKNVLAGDTITLGATNQVTNYDNMYIVGVCLPITVDNSSSPILAVSIKGVEVPGFMGDTNIYYMGEETHLNTMPTSEGDIVLTTKENYVSHTVQFDIKNKKVVVDVTDSNSNVITYKFCYAFFSERGAFSGSFLTDVVSLSNYEENDINLAYLYEGEKVYSDIDSPTFTSIPYQFASSGFLQNSQSTFNAIYRVKARVNCYVFALVNVIESHLIESDHNGWSKRDIICTDSDGTIYIMWVKYLPQGETYILNYNNIENLTLNPVVFGAKSATEVNNSVFFKDDFTNIDSNSGLPVGWMNDGTTTSSNPYFPSQTSRATIMYEDATTNTNGVYAPTEASPNYNGAIHDSEGYLIFNDKHSNSVSGTQGEKCYINKQFSEQTGLFEISLDVFAYSKNETGGNANTKNDGTTALMSWFRIVLSDGLMSGNFTNDSKGNFGPETYLNGGNATKYNIIGRTGYSNGEKTLISNLPYDTWVKLTYTVDVVSKTYKIKAQYGSVVTSSAEVAFVGATAASGANNIDAISNLGIGTSANCKNKVAVKQVEINKIANDVITEISVNGEKIPSFTQHTAAYGVYLDKYNTLPTITATEGINADGNSLNITGPANSRFTVNATRTINGSVGNYTYYVYLHADSDQLLDLVNKATPYVGTGKGEIFESAYTLAQQVISANTHNYNTIQNAYDGLKAALEDIVTNYSANIIDDDSRGNAYIYNNEILIPGQTVHVITELVDGYDIDSVSVVDSLSQVVDVTYNALDNCYEFTMPEDNVTVTISYKEATLTISIPEGVTVFREGSIVNDGEFIAKNQILDVFYDDDALYNEIMLINGVPSENNSQIIVDTQNIVIDYSLGEKIYSITKIEGANGSFTYSPIQSTYSDLEIITINTMPNAEHEVYSVTVRNASNESINVNKVNNNQYTFIMPKSDVTINTQFTTTRYEITKSSDTIINGTWGIMETRAHAGDPISLTYSVDYSNYVLNRAYYILEGTIEEVEIDTNSKVFTMPSGNITIYAELNFKTTVLAIPTGVTVSRSYTRVEGARLGALTNGDIVYAFDKVLITATAPEGYYETSALSVSGATKSGDSYILNSDGLRIGYGLGLLEILDINITVNPTKLNYVAFEEFDLTGATILATLNNSTTLDITNEVRIVYSNESSAFVAGETSVGVSYTYLTGTIKSKTIAVTVSKITPTIVNPIASEITYGQSIGESVISGGSASGGVSFAWESSDSLLTPAVDNVNTFTVIATLSDINNYDYDSLSLLNYNAENKTFEIELTVQINKAVINVVDVSIYGSKMVSQIPNGVVIFESSDFAALNDYSTIINVVSADSTDVNGLDIISVGIHKVNCVIEIADTTNYEFTSGTTQQNVVADAQVLPNPITPEDVNVIVGSARYNHGNPIVLSSNNFENVLPCVSITTIGEFNQYTIGNHLDSVSIVLTAATNYLFDTNGDGTGDSSTYTISVDVEVLPFILDTTNIEVNSSKNWTGNAISFAASDFIISGIENVTILSVVENSNTDVGTYSLAMTINANENYIFDNLTNSLNINATAVITANNIIISAGDIEYIGSKTYNGLVQTFDNSDFSIIEHVTTSIATVEGQNYINAGEVQLNITLTANSGYEINGKASESFIVYASINKLNIEVNASDLSQNTLRNYNGTKHTFELSDFSLTLFNVSISAITEIIGQNYINAGQHTLNITVIPASTNYSINGKISDDIVFEVTINKASSSIITMPNVVGNYLIGQTVANIVLSNNGVGSVEGTFSIKEPATTIIEETTNLTIIFTPNDENNYNNSERAFTINASHCVITFNSNFGTTSTNSQNVRYNTQSILNANTFTRVGYIFNGWNTQSNNSGTSYANSSSIVVTSASVVLYAQWSAIQTNITLVNNGGIASGFATATYDSDEITNYHAVERVGFTLNGYYTESTGGILLLDNNGQVINNVEGYTTVDGVWKNTNTTLSLFAQWTANEALLTFNSNFGENQTATQTMIFNQESVLDANIFTRVGYVFVGWNTNADNSGTHYNDQSAYTITELNANLYAQWELAEYIITYQNVFGANNTNSTTHTYGTATTLTALENRVGLTFVGWSRSENGEIISQIGANEITGDTTIYAVWTKYFANSTQENIDGSSWENAFTISNVEELINFRNLINNQETNAEYKSLYYKLTNNISLNDEEFSFESDSGLVRITDGKNTVYIGTGIKGKTSFTTTASESGRFYNIDKTKMAMQPIESNGIYEVNGLSINNWTAIGWMNMETYSAYAFTGKFDGCNYTVGGLFTTYSNKFHEGFFGQIYDTSNNSEIKNLGINNSYFMNEEYAGGLVAQASGVKILNCYSEAIVCSAGIGGSDATDFGGLIGYSYNAIVENCYFAGATRDAGLIYLAGNTNLKNCYNIGYVENAGLIYSDYNNSNTISNCYYLSGIIGSGIKNKTDVNGQINSFNADGIILASDDIIIAKESETENDYIVQNGDTLLSALRGYILTRTNAGNYSNYAQSNSKNNGFPFFGESQSVSFVFTGVTGNPTASNGAAEGFDYVVNLSADTGYTLPENILVTIGGVNYTGYTYSFGVITIPNIDITGPIEITAIGIANDYSVTFNANYDGNIQENTTQSITFNESANLTVNAFTRNGYTFAGWSTTQNGEVEYLDNASFTMTQEGITLFAVWSANTFILSFDSNGGSEISNKTVAYESLIGTIDSPTKTGYEFAGWKIGDTVITGTTSWTYLENKQAIAQWTAKDYLVNYVANYDGNTQENTTQSFKYNESANLITNSFTRLGYTFVGWSTTQNGEVEYLDNASFTMTQEGITLFAVWSAINYNIVFDKLAESASGEMPNQSVTFGQTVTLNSNTFTRVGHTFDGWRVEEFGDVVYLDGASFTMTTEGITLYAAWIKNYYNVTYNANFEGNIQPTVSQVYLFGTTDNLLNNSFTRENYSFHSWNTQADGLGVSYLDGSSFTMLTEGQTLFAQWTSKDSVSINTTAQEAVEYTSNGIAYSITGTDSSLSGFIIEYFVGGGWMTQAPENVGTYNVRISRNADENYLQYNSEVIIDGVTISPKQLTISGVTAVNRDYNKLNTVELTGAMLIGVINGDSITLVESGAVGTVENVNAGTNKGVSISGYALSGTDVNNYTLAQPTNVTVDIYKIKMTAKIDEKEISYGSDIPNDFTIVMLSGSFISDDSIDTIFGAIITNQNIYSTTYTKGAKPNAGEMDGKYTIQINDLSQLNVNNYEITSVDNNYITVTPVTLSVVGLSATNRDYNGNTLVALTGEAVISGTIIEGDDVYLTGDYVGNVLEANVGNNKTVYITGITLDGADTSGYVLSPITTIVNITQATNIWVIEPSISNWYIGQTQSNPSYQANFGNDNAEVLYKVRNAEDSTYSAVKPSVAGLYTMKVSVEGNDNFTSIFATYDFEIIQLTVTWKQDNGDIILQENINYGEDATFVGVPTREVVGYNYSFDKWVETVDGDIEATLTNVIQNKVVYAKYTIVAKTYTVEINSSGGVEGIQTITVTFKQELPDFNLPTNPGYRLNGLYTSMTDGELIINANKVVQQSTIYTGENSEWIYDGDVTLYAQWNLKNQIDIDINGKNPVEYTKQAVSYTITGTHSALSGFAIEYYVENAWVLDAPINAGNYSIRITRAEDTTYQAYNSGEIFNAIIITPKVLTINTTTVNREYNGLNTVTLNNSELIGIINGDTVLLNQINVIALMSSADAGTNKNVDVSGFALTGTSAGNYTVSQPIGLTVDISKATVNITTPPTVGTAYIGNTLNSVLVNQDGTTSPVIAGNFYWSNDTQKITNANGSYLVKFIPNDIANYEEAEISVTVVATQIVVSFYNEDGSIKYEDKNVDYGGSVEASTNPIKASNKQFNYTFSYWVDSVGGENTADLTNITSSMNVYARFDAQPQTYTVSTNVTNITHDLLGSNNASYGQDFNVTMIADLGYELPMTITVSNGLTTLALGAEYTYDQSSGLVTIVGENITSNIVITASAEEIVYNISYNVNGGNELDELSLVTSYSITTSDFDLPIPTKNGYTFIGWFGYGQDLDSGNYYYIGKDFIEWIASHPDGPQEGETMPLYFELSSVELNSSNTFDRLDCSAAAMYLGEGEFIAKWAEGESNYSVKHFKENLSFTNESDRWSEVISDEETLIGITGQQTAASAKAYTGFTAQTINQSVILADGSTVINVFYVRDTYSITYDIGTKGTTSDDLVYSLRYGAAVPIPSVVAKNGYEFIGFDKTVTNAVETTTITAQYSTITYEIEYELNGGNTSGTNQRTYTIESSVITLINPTKLGHNFVGWTGTGLSEPTMLVQIPSGSFENRSYVANFTKGTYNVTFHLIDQYGNNLTATQSFTFNETKALTVNPFATYYNQMQVFAFMGWSTTVQANAMQYFPDEINYLDGSNFTMTQEGVHLYAVNAYIVYFSAEEGMLSQTDGYMYLGSNTYYKTIFTSEIFTSMTLPSLTKTGYTFVGWFGFGYIDQSGVAYYYNNELQYSTDNNNLGNETLFSGEKAMPSINMNNFVPGNFYVTKFRINPYILYMYENTPTSNRVGSGELYYGQIIELPNDTFTRTGYTLSGWNTKADGTGTNYAVNAEFVMPASSTSLYAQWTANSYNVSFNANYVGNVQEATTQSIVFSESENLLTNSFTRLGYTFAGWSTTAEGEVEYLDGASYTMTQEGATLYAIWSANTYDVTFNANFEGSVQENTSQSIVFNEAELLNQNTFIRIGYAFTGWSTTADGEVEYLDNSSFTMNREGITLYAIWAEKQDILINEIANDSKEYNSMPIPYIISGTHSNLENFVITYYVDEVWTTSIPEKVGSYNVKITRAEDDNYKAFESNQIISALTITPKTLIIENVVATNRDYNATTNVTILGGTLSGIIEGDNVTLNATLATGSIESATAANNVSVTINGYVLNGNDALNYTLIQPTYVTVNIFKATPTVNNDNTFGNVFVGQTLGDVNILGGTASVSGSFAFKNESLVLDNSVNNVTIVFTPNDATNYKVVEFYANVTATYITLSNDYEQVTVLRGTTPLEDGDNLIFGETIKISYLVSTGYNFNTFEVSGANKDEGINYIVNNNVVITYSETIKTFNVRFYLYDGGIQIGESQTINYNQSAISPLNPQRVGYTFNNWDKSFDNIVSDLNVYATWSNAQYSINYHDTKGITNNNALIHTYNTQTNLIDLSNAPGFAFDGWSLTQNGNQKVTSLGATEFTNNIDLYATWVEIPKYTITFYDETGTTILSEITVEKGQDVVYNKSLPTKANDETYSYNFSKWVTVAGGSESANLESIQNNFNVYALFDKVSLYTTLSDSEQNIIVYGLNTIIPINTRIQVTPINETTDDYNNITTIMGENLKSFNVYEIGLINSENELMNGALSENITIKIKIPTNYNKDIIEIYEINGNQKIKHQHTIDGNYAVIETDKLGKYVIAEFSESKPQIDWILMIIIASSVVGALLIVVLTIVIVKKRRKNAITKSLLETAKKEHGED